MDSDGVNDIVALCDSVVGSGAHRSQTRRRIVTKITKSSPCSISRLPFSLANNILSYLSTEADMVHFIEAFGSQGLRNKWYVPVIDFRKYFAGFGGVQCNNTRALERLTWYRKRANSTNFLFEIGPSELPLMLALLIKCGKSIKSLTVGFRTCNVMACETACSENLAVISEGGNFWQARDRLVISRLISKLDFTAPIVEIANKSITRGFLSMVEEVDKVFPHLQLLKLDSLKMYGRAVYPVIGSSGLPLAMFSNLTHLSCLLAYVIDGLLKHLPRLEYLKVNTHVDIRLDKRLHQICSPSLKIMNWSNAGKCTWISVLHCPKLTLLERRGDFYGNGLLKISADGTRAGCGTVSLINGSFGYYSDVGNFESPKLLSDIDVDPSCVVEFD